MHRMKAERFPLEIISNDSEAYVILIADKFVREREKGRERERERQFSVLSVCRKYAESLS